MQWREEVRDWEENVLACANGGDSRAKGTSTCIALVVYRSLEKGFTEQVKKWTRCEEISLKSSNDSNTNKQSETIEKIIDIVEKDTEVDHIVRMVMLNTQVHKCVRKDGESRKEYTARFKAPERTSLLTPNLPGKKFYKIVSTVINNASQKSNVTDQCVSVKSDRLREIIRIMRDEDPKQNERLDECITTPEVALKLQTDTKNYDCSSGCI